VYYRSGIPALIRSVNRFGYREYCDQVRAAHGTWKAQKSIPVICHWLMTCLADEQAEQNQIRFFVA